jgi:hypothetical protein
LHIIVSCQSLSEALTQHISTAAHHCQKRAATCEAQDTYGSIYLEVDRGATLEGSKR